MGIISRQESVTDHLAFWNTGYRDDPCDEWPVDEVLEDWTCPCPPEAHCWCDQSWLTWEARTNETVTLRLT